MDCREAMEAVASGELMEGLPAHLGACASCREADRKFAGLKEGLGVGIMPPEAVRRAVLAGAGRAAAPPPRRLAWAVAAGLLAVAGLLVPRIPSVRATAPGLPADPAPVFPCRVEPGALPQALDLGGGVDVVADAGARLEAEAPGRLRLRAGRAFLRASGPVLLEAGVLRCSGSAVCFEVVFPPAPRTAWSPWRSAWAAPAATPEVAVLKGVLEVAGPSCIVRVPAGSVLSLDPAGAPVLTAHAPSILASRTAWRDGPAPWETLWPGEAAAWDVEGGGFGVEAGRLVLASGPGGRRMATRTVPAGRRFAWKAILRRPGPGYLEVALPVRTMGAEVLTLGELPQLSDGREHELLLRWDHAPALLLDGVVIRELPGTALPAEGAVLGLGVTGGSLAVSRWAWRPLP